MRLFYNATSPYARKVRVVVHEKGLLGGVEMVLTDPWASPPELLAANPLSRVPVLVMEDGRCLTESGTIAEVLNVLEPEPALLPRAGAARVDALARAALGQGLTDAAFGVAVEGTRPAERGWEGWTSRLTGAAARAVERAAAAPPPAGRFDLGEISLACALSYWTHARRCSASFTACPRSMCWTGAAPSNKSITSRLAVA